MQQVIAAKSTKKGTYFLVYDPQTKQKKWKRPKKKKLSPFEEFLAK